MKFVTRNGFFRRGPNKDGHLDPDTIQTISKTSFTVSCGHLLFLCDSVYTLIFCY